MLRFTIRDLLWLTLVVALALGWFLRERQLVAERAEHEDAMRETRRDVVRWRVESLRWRAGAEALADAAKEEDWEIEWHQNAVWVRKPGTEGYYYGFEAEH
jgi:hypothetical protein